MCYNAELDNQSFARFNSRQEIAKTLNSFVLQRSACDPMDLV